MPASLLCFSRGPLYLQFIFKWRFLGLLLILPLSSTTESFAQNKLWDKTFGGSGHDWLSTMQQTTDGGYILGGDSFSSKSGDKSQINRGKCYDGYCSADYWIVKLRADGSKEWDKTFGGYRDDKLTPIRQTQDGGYIVAGSSISGKGGDKSQGMQGGSDIWVLKLTAEGTKVWDKTFHKAGYDIAASIQQTRDRGYILGGTSNAANWDMGNYWVIKLREDGTQEWDKTIQADRADYLVTLQQTSDDGYILGGNSTSGVGGDKTEPHKGGKDPEENYLYLDYWIVKLKADGSKEWDKTLGGTSGDYLTSLQQTRDGGYIVGGTSWSEISGDKSEPTRDGYLDYWVVKLKADGTKEWDKTIGGSNHDELASLQQTLDGDYILGGHSYSGISGDKTQVSKGGQDYWLVKLNANGTKVWDETFGGTNNEVLTSLHQTRDGNFILGGHSYSDISGDKSEDNKGSCDEFNCSGDYWILKVDNSNTQLNQLITFEPILYKSIDDTPFVLLAKASSGLPVSFKVLSGPAKINGNIITLTGLGKVTIKAFQAGNGIYKLAETTHSFLVEPSAVVKKQWDKTIGSDDEESLAAVLQTSDGGYILGGTSYSLKTGENNGIWLVKLQTDGTKVWDKIIESNMGLTSLQQTSDGGFILGGPSGGGESEGNDYELIKIRKDGTKEWSKFIYGTGYAMFNSLQQTSDGGYILGGYSNSFKANQAGKDYWILKANAKGTIEWDKTYGGSGEDNLSTVQQTQDGGYILGGISDSPKSGDKLENRRGKYGSDFWVVKVNAKGDKEWDKTYGGTVEETFSALQPTSDGGFILGGYSYSGKSGDKAENPKGPGNHQDYWIIKIQADGSKVWDKTIGSNGDDYLTSILQTNDGGYVMGGTSYYAGKGGDKSQDNRNAIDTFNGGDFWIVKLQADGTKEWDKTLGGNRWDRLTSLQLTSDGGYILGGTSNSSIGGDKSESSRGGSDYWIIKIKEEQPLTTTWNMRYGGTGKDNLTTVIKTKDGGYLSGGYSTSGLSGDRTQTSQGKNDYWIVKSDKNGKKQWDKSYGGRNDDFLSSMIQTSDGGYLLAGSSTSGVSGDKSQESRGERDYWVVKVDKQGNKQWDKRYGGSGTEELKQVLQLPSGSFILAGTSNSPLSGDITQASYGQQDYWLIKINRSGKKIWDQRFGGSLNENLEGLTLTQDGGFLVGGSSASGIGGMKSQASQGASDYWVVRITGEGTPVWDKTYGGSGEDQLMALGSTGTSSGNFFLAGTSTSDKGGNKSQSSQGGKDYWLVKINPTGKKLWDKRYGGSKDEELRTVHMTPEGGYLLGGSSSSNASGDKNQASQGKSDYWVVKTSATGVKEWDQRFGGSGKEELRSVLLTNDGGYLLAGRSDSGISGDRTQPSQGGTDYWLVKAAPGIKPIIATREVTEVEELLPSNQSLILIAYPNPASNRVTVSFTLPATQSIILKAYDSKGKVLTTLFEGEAKANYKYEVKWEVNNQAAGMYLMKLQTKDKVQSFKIHVTK